MSTDTNAIASSKHGQSSMGTGCWFTIISEIGITNNGTASFYKNQFARDEYVTDHSIQHG